MTRSKDSRRARTTLAPTLLSAAFLVASAHPATAGVNLSTRLGLAEGGQVTACTGDCKGDGQVTVDELLTMVNIALGTAAITACPAGDAGGDGQITVNEIVAAVGNALSGCPGPPTLTPTPEAAPLGPVQVTSLVFGNVLPLVGTKLPSVDTFVTTAIDQGLEPVLDLLVAVEPATRERIPNGLVLDFGSGTPQPIGTMTGKITATYANVTKTSNTISFDGTINTEKVTVNGATAPLTSINMTVNASETEGGKSTMNLTFTGSGSNPPATTSGNVQVDTARCASYPVGGMITTTIGGATTTIRFNDNCNGTFGFSSSGLRQVNFLVTYFNCQYQSWYSWTIFLLSENGHLVDDLSDEEPPNLTVSGTLSDTEVDMNWDTKCRTTSCDPTQRMYGTFVGHVWKEETEGFGFQYLVRYFIGTYTSHYVKYNQDGTVRCEEAPVLNEQDGMDDMYHFLVIRP
jgi:hypothetical protein